MSVSESFTGFNQLAGALTLFFATHSVPALPGLRARMVAWMGRRGYLLAHSVIATASLVWLIVATLEAPTVLLWGFHSWTRWVPIAVMPFVCILLVAGLSQGNPFSLGIGRRDWSADRPGITAVTRHPILWAAALWSGAHLFPNGEVRALLLFGGLCGFSLMGTRLFDRRRRGSLSEWRQMAAGTSNLPFLAIIAGRAADGWWRTLFWRVVGGLGLYVGLLAAHGPVFGFYPIG